MKKPAKIGRIEIPAPFPPGSTSCYFIPGSTPTLIDPGVYSPEALRSLRSGLRELGADMGDIRRIILTHGHSDHAGLAGAAAAEARASVFVHRLDEGRLCVWSEEVQKKTGEGFRDLFEKAGVPEKIAGRVIEALLHRFRKNFSPVSDMELLKGGEVFSFDLFELRVVHTPGHTAGSICLFDDSSGLLFSGDSLLEKIVPYISVERETPMGHPRYFALEQYEKTLGLLGSLPVVSVLPGHGAPFFGHLKSIERLTRNRVRRRRRILEILDSEEIRPPGVSQFEILERLFLGASRGGALLTGISEVCCCLEVMEKEGLVAAALNGGRKLYCLNSQNHAPGKPTT